MLSQKPNNALTGQGATSLANLQASADSAHNNAVWADVSFAVALASGGAAAFLYFSRDAQPAPVVGALVPTRGGAVGALELAF